ncbi:MAG: CO dehydrogenase/acetyl-CoA synthase complex subunit epsilon [Thaumarchaeota archaeon RBG_16_49_8]|nr:MAG: CO dehydrogenase/acetyl-CoA synthase complex subunit epsilon [Thaumarchaeota archaeon RBG_16_49_8]
MATKISIKELDSQFAKIRGLDLVIGKVVEAGEEWSEPVGPTPYPDITALRGWDQRILARYPPFYSPLSDFCEFCTYGKCDLTAGKQGACGIDMEAHQGKWSLLTCVMGAACHATHAHHIVEYLIKKYGEDHPIDVGSEVDVEAPLIRLIAGIKPKKLGDLKEVLTYLDNQVTQLTSATATGQEQSPIDYESKALHAGMLDNLALEVADIAQVSALGLPKGNSDTPRVEIGMGAIDKSKPVILCVGHNVAPGSEVINYLEDKGTYGSVEVAGICCTAHDLTRYSKNAKIVGPISRQLMFVRSGIADILIIDQECVRADVVDEARSVGTRVIATSDQVCAGLPDLTNKTPDEIVKALLTDTPAVLVRNPAKVGEVAARAAIEAAPQRKSEKGLKDEQVLANTSRCTLCRECTENCPINLDIGYAVNAAKKSNLEPLQKIFQECIGCGRCDEACPQSIPVLSTINAASTAKIKEEKFTIRVGRGPIRDTEIRNVGRPIVMGEIPGVIAFVGCSNYPGGNEDLAKMADEFAKRRYIVVTSGCAASDLARYRDENGQTLYEKYPGDFDAGCIVNTGSCVSNAHPIGAVIKIASIFAKRNLRGNFEEISDYILNRIGAVAIAWGSQHQKAMAIATGANRLGVPVILGPQGVKHRRAYLGRSEDNEKWMVLNARDGKKVYGGPAPEHLLYVAETIEETMVMAARLVMRPNDTPKGRMIKLSNYINLHKQLYGTMPDDVQRFVRAETDIPVTMKDDVIPVLKERGWKPIEIPDPTLLDRMVLRRE